MPVHRNEAPTLDSQLDHAERIVARLTSDIRAEKTSKLLKALAKKHIEALVDALVAWCHNEAAEREEEGCDTFGFAKLVLGASLSQICHCSATNFQRLSHSWHNIQLWPARLYCLVAKLSFALLWSHRDLARSFA